LKRKARQFVRLLNMPLAQSLPEVSGRLGVDRAALINYVAPGSDRLDISGESVRRRLHETRSKTILISCGSLHPRHHHNILADVEHILRLGLRMITIHPPHQLLFPNDI